MTKNCLIIGIKSSLGIEIQKIFKSNNYEVFGTSRNFKKNSKPQEIFLDFENLESLNQLKNQIPNIDCLIFCSNDSMFSVCFLLVGSYSLLSNASLTVPPTPFS